MITRSEAERIVLDRLHATLPADRRAAVLDAWLKPYGWVVFYDSEAFAQSGDNRQRFFGNGPQVVLHDGTVHVLGTGRAAAVEIEAFEQQRGLAPG